MGDVTPFVLQVYCSTGARRNGNKHLERLCLEDSEIIKMPVFEIIGFDVRPFSKPISFDACKREF
jgi:hypothetical protein